MIRRSLRQREAPTTAPFALHQRIRRQRSLQQRLLVASLASLAASIVAWLFQLGLAAHAVVALGVFAVTLALPVPDTTRWALNWIRGRIGLSYQTALEVSGEEDTFGLHRAVVARAERQAGNVRPPRPAAWWLPVLASTFGLLLLPAASLPGVGRGGAFGGGSGAPDVPLAVEQADPENSLGEQLDPLGQPDDPQRVDAPQGASDGQGGEAGDQPLPQGEAPSLSDQETLDRFLENLRERDPQESRRQQGVAPPNLQPRPGDPPPPDGSEELSQRPGERGADGEPGSEQSQGDSDASEQTGDQAGDQSEQDPSGDQQGEQSAGPNEDPQGDAQPGLDEASAPQGEPSPDQSNDPGRQDSAEGDGAGDLPSLGQTSPGLEGASQNDPEFLEGRFGGGPENAGGLVRLPGSDAVDLPTGFDPESFVRAAEQAVTEGDIPVEYQEVIRNYFR